MYTFMTLVIYSAVPKLYMATIEWAFFPNIIIVDMEASFEGT